jgi:SpoVK/Ycf46/Vps4 family AAA+-type ATPase
METQKSYWTTVIAIIKGGLSQDVETTRNYSSLLVERLEEDGQKALATKIRKILEESKATGILAKAPPSKLSTARVAFTPVDPESRNTFVDEKRAFDVIKPVLASSALLEVNRFINLRRNSDTFIKEGIPTPRSLLLYGPPGCGKNTIADYVAAELELPLLTIRLDAVMSSFLGTTAKNIRTAFEYAARKAAVLLVDEFDAIAKMRDDSNEVGEIKRIVNSLIQNLDALPDLCVIAATNHEHLLDPAIWRRFDAVINVQAPGINERFLLLREFLSKRNIEESDLRQIAKLAEDYNGAELQQVTIRARQEAVLNPTVPLLQLLTKEIWRRAEIKRGRTDYVEDRTSLIQFIDRQMKGDISSLAMQSLTGIPDSTVARIRKNKGENKPHEW